MSFLDDLTNSALSGATLQVETAVTPSFSIDLTPAPPNSPKGWVFGFFKPRVTLYKGGSQIVQFAPNGDPTEDRIFRVSVLLLAILLILWLVMR